MKNNTKNRNEPPTMIIPTKFEVDTTIYCWVRALLLLIRCATLNFDLLTLDTGHTWRVTWLISPPSLKILCIRSWLMSHDIPHRRLDDPLRMRRITWPVRRGKFFQHNWSPWLRFIPSLFNFYGSTIKTNRVIRENSVRLCVKGHRDVCACAISRDLSVGGRKHRRIP